MSDYAVEKNIRIPPKDTGSKNAHYPFASMEKNDSFLVPATTEAEMKKICSRVNSAIYAYKRKHGGEFAVRTVKGKGVRVWRIA